MLKTRLFPTWSSKVLLLAIIAFGLLQTSGHVLAPIQSVPAQTELICLKKTEFGAHKLSLRHVPFPASNNVTPFPSLPAEVNSLSAYSNLIVVKYLTTSKKFFLKTVYLFAPQKTVPYDSDELTALNP